jgi:hypothetical protein
MPTAMLEAAEDVIARWRSSPDGDSPAGPLYSTGAFAEADIAAPDMLLSHALCTVGCSSCTASNTNDCC